MDRKIFNIVNLLIFICIGILLVFIAWIYSTINPETTLEISSKDWLQLSLASLWLLLTALWFFFWYNKYERDKELEIIDIYTKKYNNARKSEWYNQILNLWYEEYFLYKKWYISKELWLEWSYWMKEDIKDYIDKDQRNENGSSFVSCFRSFFGKYWFEHLKNNSSNIGFYTFLECIIKNHCYLMLNLFDMWDKKLKHWDEILKKLIKYYKKIIKNIELAPNPTNLCSQK